MTAASALLDRPAAGARDLRRPPVARPRVPLTRGAARADLATLGTVGDALVVPDFRPHWRG